MPSRDKGVYDWRNGEKGPTGMKITAATHDGRESVMC